MFAKPRAKLAKAKNPAPAPRRVPRQETAKRAVGPYADVLNSIDSETRASNDIARRRLQDNVAYVKWQQDRQGGIANNAATADRNAQRANAFTQLATAGAQSRTQSTLDAQRGERTGTVTDGPGKSREALAGDDVMTQAMLAATQKRQNSAATSSQGKAGFIAAATAASGQAAAAGIAGDNYRERKALGGEKRTVLAAREADRAAAAAAQIAAEQDAAEAAQRNAIAQASIDARLSVAELNANARASEGAANRASAGERARLSAETSRANSRTSARGRSRGSKGGGVSASETRQRGDNVRKAKNAYGTLKSAASGLRSKKVPYSSAKQTLLTLHPDLASDTAALNAALSATYDPRAKGGKPRGQALKNYQNSLKSRRQGR